MGQRVRVVLSERGPGQGWALGGRGNPKFVIAVVAAHLTGVYRTAGTGKQGWWDSGSAMPSTGWPGSPGPVLGQLAATISPKGSDLCWTLAREPGRASISDHPSYGPQERRELKEPCQARAWPATETQILQFAACPAPQRQQESQVSPGCRGPVGCLGLRLIDEAGLAQVPLRPDRWGWAPLWLPGPQEPPSEFLLKTQNPRPDVVVSVAVSRALSSGQTSPTPWAWHVATPAPRTWLWPGRWHTPCPAPAPAQSHKYEAALRKSLFICTV